MAKISFDNIAGGRLAERFDLALAQIGRNIMDPNMDPEAARGMTINLKFKPQASGIIDIEFNVTPKLAGFAKDKTTFLIGQDMRSGRIQMSEYGNNRPRVTALDAETEPAPGQEAEAGFDRETGEICEEPRGPIDLRRAVNQ